MGSIRLVVLGVLEAKPGAKDTPSFGSGFVRLVVPCFKKLSLCSSLYSTSFLSRLDISLAKLLVPTSPLAELASSCFGGERSLSSFFLVIWRLLSNQPK